jgi:hypothetical protein
MLIKPLDAVLVEFTNDAAHLVDPSRSIGLVERPSIRLYLRPFTFCRVIRRGHHATTVRNSTLLIMGTRR